jgi:hypothetical protein
MKTMSETLRDRRLRYARSILQSRPSSLALVGENFGLDGLRVLVLGTSPADTLCALMHTECRTAEARCPDAYTHMRSADLVLAPYAELTTIGRIAKQAARALDHDGRIVVAASEHERDFIIVAVRELILAGFEQPVLEQEAGQTRVHANRGHNPTYN